MKILYIWYIQKTPKTIHILTLILILRGRDQTESERIYLKETTACNIVHPSIHFLLLLLFNHCSPVFMAVQQKKKNKHIHTWFNNLKFAIHLTCTFLDCRRRKLEYLEKTQQTLGEYANFILTQPSDPPSSCL